MRPRTDRPHATNPPRPNAPSGVPDAQARALERRQALGAQQRALAVGTTMTPSRPRPPA
ncbi:MAG TPA: hypothetical protein VG406_10345 [Isosphaeraceae bacterium]|nr:hypothetical protein [Isosphaeraceae bacterium]